MVGQTVSHYRIVEKIGEGGMGVVYRAEDVRLGRSLAVKFLPQATSRDPLALERFQREARTASSLSHPGICTIYDIGEFEGQQFIAMELLEGQPLDQYIGGRPLPLRTLLDLGVQIADALDAAHHQGILHRDVKPANIYVTRRSQAKVLDFGLAKLTQASQAALSTVAAGMATGGGMALGTVAYMSPEQARGEELDPRTDLFSFGVVLHEMATGRQAFAGNTTAVVFDAILNRTPPAVSALNPEAPPELERIISKALEKECDLRYQTAADVRADLQRLRRDRESGRVGAVTTSVPPALAGQSTPVPTAAGVPAPPQRRRTVLPSIGAIGLLVGAVGLGALGLSSYLVYDAAPPATAPETGSAPDVDIPAPAAANAGGAAAAEPADAATPTTVQANAATGQRPQERGAPGQRRPARSAPAPAAAPSSSPAPAPEEDEVRQAIESATPLIAQSRFDEALAMLHGALGRQPDSASAPQAGIALASIYEQQRRTDVALAAYTRVRNAFPASREAARALARMAALVRQGRDGDRERIAHGYLTELVEQYPGAPEVPRAYLDRGLIEERERMTATDPLLERSVPAALVTYRTLAERHPTALEAEGALWKLARFYDDLKRYDLAAQALVDLGTRFPQTRHEAWWEAGQLFERRLKDEGRARDAYGRVPASSRRYRDAQRKLR